MSLSSVSLLCVCRLSICPLVSVLQHGWRFRGGRSHLAVQRVPVLRTGWRSGTWTHSQTGEMQTAKADWKGIRWFMLMVTGSLSSGWVDLPQDSAQRRLLSSSAQPRGHNLRWRECFPTDGAAKPGRCRWWTAHCLCGGGRAAEPSDWGVACHQSLNTNANPPSCSAMWVIVFRWDFNYFSI